MKLKNKKSCEKQIKEFAKCYFGNCSNKQFFNCYPEDITDANLGVGQYKKVK